MRPFRKGDPNSKTPLGQAIHAACDGVMTRRELAEKLGMSLSGVNSWAAGSRAPTLDDIARLEEACNRPRGWILSRAGYAVSEVDIETERAIRSDPALNAEWRETLAGIYDLAVQASSGGGGRSGARRRRSSDLGGTVSSAPERGAGGVGGDSDEA